MHWIKNLRNILFSFFCGLITLELGAFLFSKNELLIFNSAPSLYSGQKDTTSSWRSENSNWGAWHLPDGKGKAISGCFNVDYISNEVGARDDSFNTISIDPSNNIILLGDSFAEGVGVPIEQTSHSILEKELDKNFLNFGSSYNFGPLQYKIIYRDLASKFVHNKVVIFFLPANDFTDNDYDYWNQIGVNTLGVEKGKERHRPYYKRDQFLGSYFYPENTSNAVNIFEARGKEGKIKDFIGSYFWTTNILKTIRSLYYSQNISWDDETLDYSGYFEATTFQQRNVMSSIKEIILLAEDKEVVVVSIPTAPDYWKFLSDNRNPKDMYWHQTLTELEKKEANFRFIDLIYEPVDNYKELFHSCDGHWSEFGNKWVAEALKSKI